MMKERLTLHFTEPAQKNTQSGQMARVVAFDLISARDIN